MRFAASSRLASVLRDKPSRAAASFFADFAWLCPRIAHTKPSRNAALTVSTASRARYSESDAWLIYKHLQKKSTNMAVSQEAKANSTPADTMFKANRMSDRETGLREADEIAPVDVQHQRRRRPADAPFPLPCEREQFAAHELVGAEQ